jgi:hypothetical protein
VSNIHPEPCRQALEEARQEKAALEACAAEHAAATGRKDFAASLGMMQASHPVAVPKHARTAAGTVSQHEVVVEASPGAAYAPAQAPAWVQLSAPEQVSFLGI